MRLDLRLSLNVGLLELSGVIIQLPALGIPMARGLFEFMELSNQLLAFHAPFRMRFLQLVFEIANFGIRFRGIFLGNGTSHDLSRTPEFEELSSHLQLLLLPFRLAPQVGLFNFQL